MIAFILTMNEEVGERLKTGHWIEVTYSRGVHECDVCHDYAPSFKNGDEYLSVFCPNCGAKMVESEDKVCIGGGEYETE